MLCSQHGSPLLIVHSGDTSSQVQTIIGAKNATAYDITAACSGFVIALISAATYIRTGLYRNIIIIGADALSRYTDWRDRCKCLHSTCISSQCIHDMSCRPSVTCITSCAHDQESLPAATCILFGDGTGAMVLSAQQGQCSLLGMDSHSDGAGQKHLNVRPVVNTPCLFMCAMSSFLVSSHSTRGCSKSMSLSAFKSATMFGMHVYMLTWFVLGPSN